MTGILVNQKGCIAFANKEFCDMHGYCLEETIGKHFLDFRCTRVDRGGQENYEERMETGKRRSSMCTFDYARMGTHRYN